MLNPNDPDDKEMIDAFVEECQGIYGELDTILKASKAAPSESSNYEKYGQVIDRIYGTAATMGYKEFAEYCLMLKGICYRVSQSDNAYAQGKVRELMGEALIHMSKFLKVIYDPKEEKKYRYYLSKELTKAEALGKNALRNIRRSSTAA